CVSLVAAPSPIALCAPPLLFPASTPTGLSTLSLHDALPICWHEAPGADRPFTPQVETDVDPDVGFALTRAKWPWILALGCVAGRSEEHTSELQSRENLVCRLLLEKKKCKAFMRMIACLGIRG